MDLSSAVYAYRFESAAFSFSPDIANLGILAFFAALTVLALFAGPYAYGLSVYRRKEAEKAEKKKTIQNLLIMKDIQTELEIEMKKALTDANVVGR